MDPKQAKNRKRKNPAFVIVAVIILCVAIYQVFGVSDYIKAANFIPSAEVSSVIGELPLTGKGERILRAVAPELDGRDKFNENCESHNADIYVLGCFDSVSDRLYLYSVETKDLPGIVESTTAHELLHAVWKRTPIIEKFSLESAMQEVYDSLDENSDLKTSMNLYNKDEFYNELHSRLGTEIKDLPDVLEKHYAEYFNQDEVVAFYDSYSGAYKTLESELKSLDEKISNLKTEIESEINVLKTENDNLNTEIDEHNKKVQEYNSGTDVGMTATELNNEKNKLDQSSSSLQAKYDALNQKIVEHNNLVAEYNSKVVKSNDILDSINSNSEKVENLE